MKLHCSNYENTHQDLCEVQGTHPAQDAPTHRTRAIEDTFLVVHATHNHPRQKNETKRTGEEPEKPVFSVAEAMKWVTRQMINSHEDEADTTESVQKDDTLVLLPPDSRGCQA